MAPRGWKKVSLPGRDSVSLLLIIHLHCTLVSQTLFHTFGHRLIQRFPKAEEVAPGSTRNCPHLLLTLSEPTMSPNAWGWGLYLFKFWPLRCRPQENRHGKETPAASLPKTLPCFFTVLYSQTDFYIPLLDLFDSSSSCLSSSSPRQTTAPMERGNCLEMLNLRHPPLWASLPFNAAVINIDMKLLWAELDVFAYIKLFEGTPQCTVTGDTGLLKLKRIIIIINQ